MSDRKWATFGPYEDFAEADALRQQFQDGGYNPEGVGIRQVKLKRSKHDPPKYYVKVREDGKETHDGAQVV